MAHDLAPKEIIAEKLDQAARKIKEQAIDLWVTFVQETSAGVERVFSYVSPGHLTWESVIAVTPGGERFVICGKFDQQDFEESGLFTEVYTYVEDFKEPFGRLLQRVKPGRVALNFSFNDPTADGISHGKFVFLQGLLKEMVPTAQVVSAEAVVLSLISSKSPIERSAIQEGVDLTVKIFGEIDAFLRPGLTEKEIYGFIQERILSYGVTPSFQTLVFTGDRGAGSGHGSATENPVQPGDLVHVDMGVFVRGYASDMQRTWYVLKPGEDRAPEPAQKGFDTIVLSIEASGRALKPGAKGIELDTIARKVVTDAGYPEYPHALGHQIGRHVHDGGALLGPAWARYRNTPFLVLEAGQIFTLEPSLTVPGFGAVGIEEDAIVTRDGARYMAPPQRKLWMVRGK